MRFLPQILQWVPVGCLSVGLLITPSFGQSSREYNRYDIEVEVDGETHAQFSFYGTSDGLSPYRARLLYEDDAGNLLVLRQWYDSSNHTGATTYELLATGEVLRFASEPGHATVILGGNAVEITTDELIAYSGENGTEFPPTVLSAAATLFGGASQSFRDSLRWLSYVGCEESSRLYNFAIYIGPLFFPDDAEIDCVTEPTVQYGSGLLGYIANFDPYQTPPNAFEQQFGTNYYE